MKILRVAFNILKCKQSSESFGVIFMLSKYEAGSDVVRLQIIIK